MADEQFIDHSEEVLEKIAAATDAAVREIAFNVESLAKQNVASINAIDYGVLLNSIHVRFSDKSMRDLAIRQMKSKIGKSGRKSKDKLAADGIRLGEPLQIVLKPGMAVVAVAAEYGPSIEYGYGINVVNKGKANAGRIADGQLVKFIPPRPFLRPAVEFWEEKSPEVFQQWFDRMGVGR